MMCGSGQSDPCETATGEAGDESVSPSASQCLLLFHKCCFLYSVGLTSPWTPAGHVSCHSLHYLTWFTGWEMLSWAHIDTSVHGHGHTCLEGREVGGRISICCLNWNMQQHGGGSCGAPAAQQGAQVGGCCLSGLLIFPSISASETFLLLSAA